MSQQPYNRAVHVLALITAAAMFPLIFSGGLVTSHGAGMSVPDWPNSWGYNMFTFPPSKWVGGILFEHTHRLGGSVVGMLAIILAVTAWRTDERRWMRWTAVGVLLAICAQGILGGLRVLDSNLDLAMVHACSAQLCFCFISVFCVLTSRLWADRPLLDGAESVAAIQVFRISILTGVVIFGQLVVGAIMRHSDAGLAIPDFPTSFGRILPPTWLDAAFREEAIRRFGLNLGLNRVTLFQIWIHFSHRVGAVLVSAAVIWLCATILARLWRWGWLARPAMILLVLLAVQVTLGILTVLLRKPADIASAHVAVGSLILMTTCVVAVRAYGLMRGPAQAERRKGADFPGVAFSSSGTPEERGGGSRSALRC